MSKRSTRLVNAYEHSTASNKQARNARGVSLAFIGFCAVLLIALVYIGFNYSMLLSGSRQVGNSVDAAVLNVSKRMPESRIASNAPYLDCADSQGTIGLGNINRIWGKALLIASNSEDMKRNGEATGRSTGNAETAYGAARRLNDDLYAKLTDNGLLNMYYQDIAEKRNASMLGESSSLKIAEEEEYHFGLVGRGQNSNLSFDIKQFAPGSSAHQALGSCDKWFHGYTPIVADGKSICFTTIAPGGMPQLISDSIFQQNRSDLNPIATPARPIPNAVMATGVVSGSRGSLKATASAVANPRHTYRLSIPHAYVAIRYGHIAEWYVQGKMIKVTPYGYEPETIMGIKDFELPSGRTMNGYASLGNEYSNPTLLAVASANPTDKEAAYEKMAQRVGQIVPGFTVKQLKAMLDNYNFNPSHSRYFLYPVYSTPDLVDPKLRIGTTADNLPSWLNPELPPDGAAKPAQLENATIDEPNYSWYVIVKGKPGGVKKRTEFSGTVYWQPGTGAEPCLGELRFSRVTRIFFEEEPQSGNQS